MGRSFIIESHEFQVGNAWAKRSFTAVWTLLTGESGSGKSAGFEALWYALGLTAMKIMPAVRACARVRVTFAVDGTRWRATRSAAHSGGFVEFENLTAPDAGIVRRPIRSSTTTDQSAGDFLLELLAIPRAVTGGTRLGMDQVLPWLYLRQATIATTYLGGSSSAQRRLAGRALLGLHDDHLEQLRARLDEARRAWQKTKNTLDKLLAARKDFGLPAHADLQAVHRQWTAEHAKAAEAARAAGTELAKRLRHLQTLEDAAKAAYPARDEARRAADQAEQRLRAAVREEALAEGALQAMDQPDRRTCPQCHQKLQIDGLPADRCPVCKQVDAGRGQDRAEQLAAARRRLERARAARQKAEQAAEKAREAARAADTAVRAAHEAARTYREQQVDPQREQVKELEARARELAARLEQLAEHMKEVEVIATLEAELARLADEKIAAKEALDAAEQAVTVQLKILVSRWSELFAHRMAAAGPQYRSAVISEDDFTPIVDNIPFEEHAVAGGTLTVININAALSLRDLAREVPSVALPTFLMADTPLSGLGTHGCDQHATDYLLQALGEAAAATDALGRPTQVIAAASDPLSPAPPTLRQIHLSLRERYIDADLAV